MSIVVVGSVAFDSLETPVGRRDRCLGGSANYFSISASMLTDVKLCAVVGDDFPAEHTEWLGKRGIDTSGLMHASGKTFHWTGRYGTDLNEAQTLGTDLNVFADFDPQLPASYVDATTVFLANIDPDLQRKVLSQVKKPRLIGMDSMNLWINIKRESLVETIRMVDVLFLNETESRLLSGEHNIVRAAKAIQKLSQRPLTLVIKRGEYGALLFRPESKIVAVPAWAVEDVFDPTGAGDTFAAGCMGSLDRTMKQDRPLDDAAWRRAMMTGTVMASFVVEDFSFDRMRKLQPAEVRERGEALRQMTTVDALIDI
ncbi:MAG: PfkB family carbohydrate kinase [Deltaproteobacteria bacterium]|nr:PfkB family carbohydrate kinase [Deltaproteobacteria bacterium]